MNKRYIITLLVSFLFVFSWGLNNAYSVFIVPLADALNTGRGTITLGGTIAGLLSGLFSPVMVRIVRRYPFKLVISLSTIIYALIMFVMGFSPNAAFFLFINILKGFVMVVYNYNIIILVLGYWFVKGRETFVGMALACSGLSGAIFSQVFDKLFQTFGLHISFSIYAALLIILALPTMLLVHLKPEEVGLTAYGAEEEVTTVEKKEEMVCPFSLKSPVYLCIAVLYFLIVVLTNVSSHLVGYAGSIGFASIGATMLSISMVGNVVFKTLIGSVCDKFGPETGYPVAIVISMIGFGFFVLPSSTLTLCIGSFLYGACYSCIVVTTPMTRFAFGNAQYFDAFAKVVMLGSVSSLAGPMIGYLYDFTGSYVYSLYVSIGLCVLALLIYILTLKLAQKHRTLKVFE